MATIGSAHASEEDLGWIDAGRGYQLALDGGKLAARNGRGKRLATVPKELRGSEAAARLEALRDWLAAHERACAATALRWMLRSLPVPRAVIAAVWDDAAWRRALEDAVIAPVGEGGAVDHARAGLLRGVDPRRGVGVVELDGETAWLDAELIVIPHPILIPELDGWRELVAQLGVAQGVPQLHRETYPRPVAPGDAGSIARFEDGRFAMLLHALNRARTLGYRLRNGYAVCKVWDGGAPCEARYWLGADVPYAETYTGALSWVDERGRGLAISAVGPVAFSEGMRMAAAIYAARVADEAESP